MNRWQASIPADKVSIFNLVSLTNLSLKLQFCTKKAAMKLSSLPLKMSVSYRNRTYNRVLGGPRYIHLTKETNAVLSGFSALLAPAAISMNSITLVMNFHCILFWHSGQSLLESNSDLSLLNFHKSQPWLNLRRLLLYPFNYENNIINWSFREIDMTLHPDDSFESSACFWFSQKILFIDADIKIKIIAADRHLTDLFFGHFIFHELIIYNLT